MKFDELLKDREAELVELWFEKTISAYAPESAKFIRGVKNRFANPVGSATIHSIKALLPEVLAGGSEEKLTKLFDPILRIRAVQSFSASKSVGFVFFLKVAVRELIAGKKIDDDLEAGLKRIDDRVDRAALVAFDGYMSCREKVFRLKATEDRNITFSAFERAGLVREIPVESDDKDLL